MELQEVIKDLPEEKRVAILEIHQSAVEQERSQAISANKRKNDEVKKYMTETNKYKDTLKEHLDLDFTSTDDPFGLVAEKLKTFKTQTTNTNEYTAKLSRLEKQIAEISQREQAAQQKLNTVKISDALSRVMGDSFHAADFVIKNMIASGEVRLLDDGSVVFVDGDDEIDLQKGIEKLKKNRPDLVKNISKPGSSGTAGMKNKGSKEISLDEFNTLPGKDRARLMSEGYKLI